VVPSGARRRAIFLTHRTYHATPCNKKWQAIIELPKRPGVQCGGQAGVSRRRGDGSKAPSSARTARPHLGVRCSSGLGAPASTARRLRVGWSPTSPPITDELTSVLAFHGQHAFALGTIIASAESRPDLGRRWPSRLVATAAEDRLIFRRKAHVVCGSQRLPNNCSGFGPSPGRPHPAAPSLRDVAETVSDHSQEAFGRRDGPRRYCDPAGSAVVDFGTWSCELTFWPGTASRMPATTTRSSGFNPLSITRISPV
jgi:hypothetical protein